MHVVCAWIGNTKAVAAKHYLQVTEDHFRKATQHPAQSALDEGDSDGQQQQEPPAMSACDMPGQWCTSSGGGTRTPDTRIMIPLL